MTTYSEHLTGARLVDRVRELVHHGDVHRITIRAEEGYTIAEFPMHEGEPAALQTPTLAAVGSIAALVCTCTIEVQRDGDTRFPELCEAAPAD